MEKMTRMSKYKELRENLKNDVVTTKETETYVANEEIIKDANYYRNLVGDNQVEIKQAVHDDTLYEALTFETITENETDEVKTAIEKVRENKGLDQYNTRMDILNKIRQSKVETPVVKQDVVIEEEFEEVIEEETKEEDEVTLNRFGYVKEENIESDEEIEEEPKKKFGFFKKKNKEIEEDIEEDDDIEESEDEEEGSSFIVKLLNGCIVILVLVLFALLVFIAKEIIF